MHIQSEYRKMERNLRRLMIRVELVKSRRYIIDVYIVITMFSTYVLILYTIIYLFIYLYYVSDMCYKLGWWIMQVLRSHYRRRSVIEGTIFLVNMYLSSCSICICILIKFFVIYSMSTLIMTMRIWFYIISYTCIDVYVSMPMYLYRALC